MIKSVTKKNIKGFDNKGKRLQLNLSPDKYNICFAPNGFCKTSLATAISMLESAHGELKYDKDRKPFTFRRAL